jgi:ribosomal protein S18 acetylase RimI-like enzyme
MDQFVATSLNKASKALQSFSPPEPDTVRALVESTRALCQELSVQEARQASNALKTLVELLGIDDNVPRGWEVCLHFLRQYSGQVDDASLQKRIQQQVGTLESALGDYYGEYGEISLEKLTPNNVKVIGTLSDTLSPEARLHLKSNDRAIARASVREDGWCRAVYAGAAPAGLIILHLDTQEETYHLQHLMIAAPYQGRGWAGKTVDLAVNHVRSLPGATELTCSVAPGAEDVQAFWEDQGFEQTGRRRGIEPVYRYEL